MSTLITGASGFLGGRLAQILGAEGEETVVLARRSSDLSHLANTRHRVALGDLTDTASLQSALQGITHIVHCAACSTDWASNSTYYAANVLGTTNLITAALRVPNLERFVHVSTTDVYGYPAVPCSEESPMRDAGLPYNQTKRLGELAVWAAHDDHKLPATIIRPATIYGPRGKDFTVEIGKLLRMRLMTTVDGGRSTGGFIYVDNVARAIIQARVHPAAVGEAFNLSDGTDTTWAQYLHLFSGALSVRPPWIDLTRTTALRIADCFEAVHRRLHLRGRPLLTRHAVLLLGVDQEFPSLKAATVFGFAPTVGIHEGIARSVGWLKGAMR